MFAALVAGAGVLIDAIDRLLTDQATVRGAAICVGWIAGLYPGQDGAISATRRLAGREAGVSIKVVSVVALFALREQAIAAGLCLTNIRAAIAAAGVAIVALLVEIRVEEAISADALLQDSREEEAPGERGQEQREAKPEKFFHCSTAIGSARFAA